MAEEATTDVNTSVESAPTVSESSTDEVNTELTELDFGDEEESKQPELEADEPKEKQEQDKSESPDKKESEKPQENQGAEKRKQQLNTEIRDKVAERNQLRAEIAELNRQKYQLNTEVPNVNDLVSQVNPETGDYYTRIEAELAQLKAEREIESRQKELDDYTEKIVEQTMQLKDESERVLKEYPMFDQNSPDYNEVITKATDAILDKSLEKDNVTGRIIGSRVSPYQLYSTIAQVYNLAKQTGEAEARKSVQMMMNSADVANSPSATSSKTEDDPYMDGFNS